ncbi:MAG: sigma 54-interacting transcriptional regulator [Nannocystaceae bacterium]
MSRPRPHTEQLADARGVVALRRRPLRLTVTAGPDRRRSGEFVGDRLVVGTHEGCDFVLTDPTISRQHLEITLAPAGYVLTDLDSRNGTFLGDVRIREVIVERPVKLTIGATTLHLQPLADAVDLPLVAADRFGPLLGRSPAMRRLFEVLTKIAPSDATVLLTGESGTGKEVAARAIHEASPRRDRPFVVVDCAGLPPSLIESELYGHVRGAFTGAARARDGAFASADGGTLLLDELGELPLELQTRLLGALERRQVQPIGADRPRAVDVRVIAATHRDLRKEVNRGAFRADLYFRLAVVQVHLPPLRERPEDVPVYVEAMLAEWAEAGASAPIDAETLARLQSHPWPGNVRELRNTVERALLLGELSTPAGEPEEGAHPSLADAGAVDPAIPFKVAKAALIERFERAYVEAQLRACGDNISAATRAAGVDRVYMLRLLDKYGLRPGRR